MIRESNEKSHLKMEDLLGRLEEMEQLIEAIKTGEVDAFAIRNPDNEPEVYSLQSGDYAYRVLIEELEESALNVTEDGLIVYTNPYFCNLLKLPYEKVIGAHIFDFIHAGSKEDFAALFNKSLKRKSKGEINLDVNGIAIPAYVSLTSLQPKLPTIGILITDLTEKLKTRRLEESARELQQLVKQAPVSIVLLEGEDLIARVANETALMVMGKSESEVLHHRMEEYFPEVPERKKIYQEVLRTGQTYVGKEVQITFNRFGKPHTGYYDLNYSPWFGNDGKIKGVMAVGVDVTEKVLARKQIEQNNAMIRNMYMTAPAFVAVFKGPEHVYELVNPYYQAMIGGREVIGKPLLTALPELKGQGIDTTFDHVFTTGETVIHRESLVMLARGEGKEPEEAYFDYSFQPIYDEQQTIIGVLAYGTDITQQVRARKIVEASASELEQKVQERTVELKKTNRDLISSKEQIAITANQLREKNLELEQINEELASFNYIASHDLQEPLRKIETFLRLVKKYKEDETRVNKFIDVTIESANRMSSLIQSVLNYSRVSKTPHDDFVDTDLNKILNDVRADYELQIEEKQAVIESGKLPVIKASPLQIQQLFSNLISNSLKFSGEKPHITITSKIVSGSYLATLNGNSMNPFSSKSLKGDEEYAEIKFSDNGIGFDPHYTKKIFDLFQRLHGKSEYGGTGIGLSIAKKIVERHNGFISAESEVNKGATFTIWLPVNHEIDSIKPEIKNLDSSTVQ